MDDKEKNIIKKKFFLLSSLFIFGLGYYAAYLSLTVDNLQIFQTLLRASENQKIYNDFGIPYGFVIFFIFKIIATIFKVNIELFYAISSITNLFAAYIFYKICYLETKNKNLSYFAFIIGGLTFSMTAGGLYMEHASTLLALFAIYLFLVKKNDLTYIGVGFLFFFCFAIKTSVGLVIIFGFALSVFLTYKIKEIFFSKTYYLIFAGFISALLLSFLYLILIEKSKINLLMRDLLIQPLSYSNEQNKLYQLLYSIILPFKVSILESFYDIYKNFKYILNNLSNVFFLNNTGLGRILFFPFIILIYFFYYYLIKNKKNFLTNFLIIVLPLIIGISGKGREVLILYFFLILIITLNKMKINNKKIFYYTICLILINFLFFIKQNLYIKSICDSKRCMSYNYKVWNISEKNALKLINFIEVNQVKNYAYFDDDVSFIQIYINKAPKQYYTDFPDNLVIPLNKIESFDEDYSVFLKESKPEWFVLYNGKKSLRRKDQVVLMKNMEKLKKILDKDYLVSLNNNEFTAYKLIKKDH